MKLFWTVFFLWMNCQLLAQDTTVSKKNIRLMKNAKKYLEKVALHPEQRMLSIGWMPGIVMELKYATSSNFTGQKLYPCINTTYLRRDAVMALWEVQKKLSERGLAVKIFDAYRPYSVSARIWNLVNDERYAANPSKGSNHNRGIAVDLTIIDSKTMKELDMGTGFDSFSDSAHHNFKALPDSVLENRQLLRNMMEQAGFKALETEWWHYALPDAEKYDLLDLSFEQLKKNQPKPIICPIRWKSSVPASSDQPAQKQ